MYSFVKILCPQRWGHTGFFIFMFPFVFCLPNFNLVIITSEPCNTKDVPPVGVYIKTFCQETYSDSNKNDIFVLLMYIVKYKCVNTTAFLLTYLLWELAIVVLGNG